MPDEVPAGGVLIEVSNAGTAEHGFAIEGVEGSIDSLPVDGLEELQVELEPGTYTAFSPVEGDRDAGIERTFTVVEADESETPIEDEGAGPGEQEPTPSPTSDDGG
jgi:hypothetical protein